MSRWVLAAALCCAACGPRERLVSRDCGEAEACAAGSACRDGRCVPVEVVESEVPDAGVPLNCGLRTACGGVCCGRGEVCRGDRCVWGCTALSCEPPARCSEDFVACVRPVIPQTCEDRPSAGPWEITELWHSVAPDLYRHVIGAPVVLDVNGDGAADVIAIFASDFGYAAGGKVRALSGRDGRMLWETAADYSSASGLAIADLAGAEGPTVFAYATSLEVVALDAATGLERRRGLGKCATLPASLLGAPWPAIGVIAGRDGGRGSSFCAGAPSYFGPIAIGFDTSDFRFLGNRFGGVEGFPAVADLFDAQRNPGRDLLPEVVIVPSGPLAAGGFISVVDPARDLLISTSPLPHWNPVLGACVSAGAPDEVGGAPAIADVDGDGIPEVAVAGSRCLSVLRAARNGGLEAVWSRAIQDLTSGVTAVSAFDFDADGRAEILHADETTFRILDGSSGVERFSSDHCSATAYDMPIVADLNGDGRAEVILATNTFSGALVGCSPGVSPGIRVLTEKNGRWANARPVWNQHGYHLTNVCDGEDLVCGGPFGPANAPGRLPAVEPTSWRFFADGRDAAPYNGYRLATGSRFDAPNLAVAAVVADPRQCPAVLSLSARVENRAMQSAPPGALVQFLLNGEEISRARTTRRLRAGEYEIVSASWSPGPEWSWPARLVAIVDGDRAVRQCSRTDDTSDAIDVRCD